MLTSPPPNPTPLLTHPSQPHPPTSTPKPFCVRSSENPATVALLDAPPPFSEQGEGEEGQGGEEEAEEPKGAEVRSPPQYPLAIYRPSTTPPPPRSTITSLHSHRIPLFTLFCSLTLPFAP